MDHRLKEYIERALEQGFSKEHIYSNLHAVGWAIHEIEEALLPQRKKPWYRWDGYRWRHYFHQKEVRQSFQIFTISLSLLCLTIGTILGYEYYRDFNSAPPQSVGANSTPPLLNTPTPAPSIIIPTAWQTFRHEQLKFSLEIPAGWFVREIKSPNAPPEVDVRIIAIDSQPISSDLLKSPPFAHLIISPSTGSRMSWYQAQRALVAKKQAQTITISDIKAIQAESAVGVVHLNQIYELHFIHPINGSSEAIDHKMIGSFRFL